MAQPSVESSPTLSVDELKRQLFRQLEPQKAEIAKLFAQLAEKSIMFLPAGRLNWQPVAEFASVCDLFIFSDWTASHAEFQRSVQQLGLPTVEFCKSYFYGAFQAHVENCVVMSDLPWLIADPGAELPERWAEIIQVKCRLGPRRKQEVWLIYLSGNPVDAYRSLFTQRGIAPKFVYLRRPDDVPAQAWREFVGERGALRNAINENPHGRPQYYIREVGVGGD